MRQYILTPKERDIVEAFIKTGKVPEEDKNSYHQIRHQYKTHRGILAEDQKLLEKFMATPSARARSEEE